MTAKMPALVKRKGAPGIWLESVKTGICGTDLRLYAWDDWAKKSRVHPPFIVGHGFMGVIEAVGEGVEAFSPGEPVSGEGHIGCGHCYFCREGQGHICRRVEIIGVDPRWLFCSVHAFAEDQRLEGASRHSARRGRNFRSAG
jgi:threonine 3-dehydrogenase